MAFNRVALDEFRRLRDFRPTHLAAEAGVTPSYLCELISGRRECPSLDKVVALANALKVEPEALAPPDPPLKTTCTIDVAARTLNITGRDVSRLLDRGVLKYEQVKRGGRRAVSVISVLELVERNARDS